MAKRRRGKKSKRYGRKGRRHGRGFVYRTAGGYREVKGRRARKQWNRSFYRKGSRLRRVDESMYKKRKTSWKWKDAPKSLKKAARAQWSRDITPETRAAIREDREARIRYLAYRDFKKWRERERRWDEADGLDPRPLHWEDYQEQFTKDAREELDRLG